MRTQPEIIGLRSDLYDMICQLNLELVTSKSPQDKTLLLSCIVNLEGSLLAFDKYLKQDGKLK